MAPKQDQQATKKNTKLMHSLGSPFPEPAWPQIEPEQQVTILELFCRLLEPIGHHNKTIHKSKGKREKHKKPKEASAEEDVDLKNISKPEIASFVTIGFNSTQRKLEELVRTSETVKAGSPVQIASGKQVSNQVDTPQDLVKHQDRRLVAVFVDRSSQPPILIQHLPTMTAAAARSLDSPRPIWLITLPNGSEEKLRDAVAIPRVGLFGILEEAPGSTPLLDYVKANVQPVKPLLEPSLFPSFRSLNVETKLIETQISKTVRRQQEKSASALNTEMSKTTAKRPQDNAGGPGPKKIRR